MPAFSFPITSPGLTDPALATVTEQRIPTAAITIESMRFIKSPPSFRLTPGQQWVNAESQQKLLASDWKHCSTTENAIFGFWLTYSFSSISSSELHGEWRKRFERTGRLTIRG